MKSLRLGILGGTFNPIHLGHMWLAQDALERGRLDRVIFVPAALSPHKRAPRLAPARHRLRMIQLAIAGDRRFAVDDIELRRGGKSYSVETLATLRARHRRAQFFFILGADSYAELHRWREIARLARLCRFLVFARPGYELKNPRLDGLGVCARRLTGHQCGISSTEIRARAAAGGSLRYLVPEAVRQYLERQRLYCSRCVPRGRGMKTRKATRS